MSAMSHHSSFTLTPAELTPAITLTRIVTGPLQENSYILAHGDNAIIIDPGDDAGVLLHALKPYKLAAILLTHAHFDHVGAVKAIRQALGTPVYLHPDANEQLAHAAAVAGGYGISIEQPAAADLALAAGTLKLIGLTLLALDTPGHAPGHLAFYLAGQNGLAGTLIAGDALFRNSIGRTDLPGGNHQLLLERIKSQLLTLPAETVVFAGHGAETTIGNEAMYNPYLA
jgi:hydroxyacylglutathione hydrolase